jgi:DNA-binding LacI/PurR family transcriptional regulator
VETACTVRDRLDGYKDALAAARLEFDPSLVFLGPFQEPENERYEAIVSQILQTPNPPTAIFAVNDYSALCVAASLQRAGVQIPHNIEIAGVDDLERWRPGNGLLTTVRQPFERIGTEAARLLVQRLEKQDDAGVFTNVIMDAPLIVRT